MPLDPLSTFLIHLSLSLFALAAAWQLAYLPTMVDVFRQKIFSLRRDLFRLMAHGLIAPGHPAYGHLRTRMNGLLRFAERISFSRLVFTSMINCDHQDEVATLEQKIDGVEDEVIRAKLRDVDSRIMQEVAWHIIKTSPFCLFVVVPLIVLLILARGMWKRVRVPRFPILSTRTERALIRRLEHESDLLTSRARRRAEFACP